MHFKHIELQETATCAVKTRRVLTWLQPTHVYKRGQRPHDKTATTVSGHGEHGMPHGSHGAIAIQARPCQDHCGRPTARVSVGTVSSAGVVDQSARATWNTTTWREPRCHVPRRGFASAQCRRHIERQLQYSYRQKVRR